LRRRSLTHAAVAVALGAAAMGVAHRIRVAQDRPYDIQFVPTAASLRWASLGHPTLAANLNWLRTVQYVGDERADERGWDKLRPMIELVTDLDPRHGYAYQVGANFLSSVGRIDDSNAILEKGTLAVPNRYILPFHRAVNAFLYEADHALAGRYFEIAARTPGAPEHLREYVIAQYVRGDDAGAAVAFLQRLEAEASDDDSRRSIHAQIVRVSLERIAEQLEREVERYRLRVGIAPVALAQLVYEGLIPDVPADPFGGTLYLDGDGRVRSSVNPRRFDKPKEEGGRVAARERAWARLKSLEEAQR
jgi:hypothetical protein